MNSVQLKLNQFSLVKSILVWWIYASAACVVCGHVCMYILLEIHSPLKHVWYVISASLLENSTVPTWSQVTYSLIKSVNCKVTWSHMHTFCDGRPYLRVIGTGYLTVHSKFGVSLTFGSWSYTLSNLKFRHSYVWKFLCIIECCFLLLLWSNYQHVFGSIGKYQYPAATCPIFIVVAASGTERCHWMSTRSCPL